MHQWHRSASQITSHFGIGLIALVFSQDSVTRVGVYLYKYHFNWGAIKRRDPVNSDNLYWLLKHRKDGTWDFAQFKWACTIHRIALRLDCRERFDTELRSASATDALGPVWCVFNANMREYPIILFGGNKMGFQSDTLPRSIDRSLHKSEFKFSALSGWLWRSSDDHGTWGYVCGRTFNVKMNIKAISRWIWSFTKFAMNISS